MSLQSDTADPRVFYSRDVEVAWRNHLSRFELLEPYDVLWVDGEGETLAQFTVEAGLLTDGPSIPKRLRSIVPWYGHHFQPAVTHDDCYRHHHGLTRAQVDQMFLDGMKDEGVWWGRRQIIYRAVRLGGGFAWKSEDREAVDPFPSDWNVLD